MRKASAISPKVFISGSVILVTTLFFVFPNFAVAQELTVMTRNLYIGAEIQSLAAAENEDEFIAGVQAALMQMAANNFPERALALATEIIEKNPHLIGLQEVYNLTINGQNGPPPYRDYLDDLLNALKDQGADYYVAATVVNLNFSQTIGPVELGVIDRDVILAREDVFAQVVDPTLFCPADRLSMDGCNYRVVAVADTPVGPIAFQRGYVGVVTPYGLFFNTHLEVRNPDPSEPLSPLVQRAQAMELIFVLNVLLSGYSELGPVILVGDINSSPEDFDNIFGLDPPYMQFEAAKYVDAWTLRSGSPKGFTCCYDEDLKIPADLYERIDVIFSSVEPDRVKANVVGNDETDQTPSGLWPSDHAGVAAEMEF